MNLTDIELLSFLPRLGKVPLRSTFPKTWKQEAIGVYSSNEKLRLENCNFESNLSPVGSPAKSIGFYGIPTSVYPVEGLPAYDPAISNCVFRGLDMGVKAFANNYFSVPDHRCFNLKNNDFVGCGIGIDFEKIVAGDYYFPHLASLNCNSIFNCNDLSRNYIGINIEAGVNTPGLQPRLQNIGRASELAGNVFPAVGGTDRSATPIDDD